MILAGYPIRDYPVGNTATIWVPTPAEIDMARRCAIRATKANTARALAAADVALANAERLERICGLPAGAEHGPVPPARRALEACRRAAQEAQGASDAMFGRIAP
ncbi:MAG: hypothetical protein ACEQSH_00455 [Bacteroidia bacterium]